MVYVQDLTMDGATLNDPAGRWLVSADSRLRQPPSAVISDVQIPSMHGVLSAKSAVYGPGQATLAMDLRGTDYDDLLVNHATVASLLGSRLRLRNLGDQRYRAFVQYASATELEVGAGGVSGSIAYTFSLPLGFWQDESATVVNLSGGTNSPAALKGGSAPITDALFIVTSGTTVTDTVTESWFRWEGSGTARINPSRQTAYSSSSWTGGSNVSGKLVMGPGQFQLDPSINFVVSGGGGSVSARRAYL